MKNIKTRLVIIAILLIMPILSGCAIITFPFKVAGTALDITSATVKTAANVTTSVAKAAANPIQVALF